MASEPTNNGDTAPVSKASAALLESRKRVQMELQVLQSDMQTPRLMSDEIARLNDEIKKIHDEAELKILQLARRKLAIQSRRDNIKTLYIEATERLDQLNREIKLAGNQSTLDRYNELKRQIAELEAEMQGVKG